MDYKASVPACPGFAGMLLSAWNMGMIKAKYASNLMV